MLKRFLFTLTIISLFSLPVLAQDLVKPERKWRDRVFFGGDFSMQFGTITDIEVGPLVGYRIFPRLSVATGIKYEFYMDKRFTPAIETHIYGARTFLRYMIIPDINKIIPINFGLGIYLQGEYEGLSLERKYFDHMASSTAPGRFWLSSAFIGGGLRQPIGPRSFVNFSVLYNLNESANSIYSNPLFRIGFTF